jgi:23S rRNA (uracil-5-)-methyltransferase RumA
MNTYTPQEIKKGNILEIEIEDMAFGGKGLAKLQVGESKIVMFVPNTIPGQKVKARIFKKRKKHLEGKLIEIVSPSPEEVKMNFQPISGAPYLTLPVENQREYKQRTTIEQYRRIGKVANIEEMFDTYIESPASFHYRNKMEYAFSTIRYDFEQQETLDDEFALGFKRRGTWWIVESLDKDSGLFDEEFENKLKEVRDYLEKTGLPAWHPPKKHGFYRYLTVRKSFANNQLLLNLTTSATGLVHFDKQAFVDFVLGLLGKRVAGILHTINDSLGERSHNDENEYEMLFGENLIQENLLGLSFEVSMQSFFQTNPKSAERLYSKVIEYVMEDTVYSEEDTVMDLFCGTGTIGQLISKKTGVQVIGVDIVSEAIENAKENAKRNNVETAKWFAADVGKFLTQYPQYAGKIKTIVLDPPRGGIAPKTLLKVSQINAQRIVYVSCNPATQSRDIEVLKENGYDMIKISFVDQFPHTAHIEAIAIFEKTKN